MKIFKREYYTLIKNFNISNIIPKKYIEKNYLFKKIDEYLLKISNDVNKGLPKLHRWCTKTSPIYAKTCNWELKMENANKDNCYR